MSFLSKLLSFPYNDKVIVSSVQAALHEDPQLTDASALTVTSEKGLVRIIGTVFKEQEIERIEDIALSVLAISDLKYKQIVNDLVTDSSLNRSSHPC